MPRGGGRPAALIARLAARPWLVASAVAGALLSVATVTSTSPREQAIGSAGAAAIGLMWACAGVRRHRPAGAIGWLIRAALGAYLIATLVWWGPILLGGDATLAQPSLADVGFLGADQLLCACVFYALTRREPPLLVGLDVITIALGAGIVLGVALIGPDIVNLPIGVGIAQAAYAVSDVVAIAVALRVVLAPRGRPVAMWLMAAAALSIVTSDVLWNWLTVAGTYTPGNWADLGWLAAPLLLGAAALHPSVRSLGGTERREDVDLRPGWPLLLGAVSLLAPLMLGAHAIVPAFPEIDSSAGATTVILGGALLSGLVVARFLLLVSRARRLTEAVASALDERGVELDRSEARYQRLVEQLPAVMYVIAVEDPRAPQARYVSPQAQAIMGITLDPAHPDTATVVRGIHPEDRPRVAAYCGRVAAGERAEPLEFRFRRPDGEEIWLREDSATVLVEDGVRCIQGVIFDITAAKRAEADRVRMEMELRLAQKLEAAGQLAAGVAHEINTPIQFVGDTVRFLGNAFEDLMVLLETYGDLRAAAAAGAVSPDLLARIEEAEDVADLAYLTERVPAAFERGIDGVQRVATIVQAMRQFAHPTAEKAPVDLNEAVRNTLIVSTNAYKYIADVETDLGDVPAVVCNGGDINQVLLNLVVNAAHAIEDVVGDSGERGAIRVRSRVDGDNAVISIGDTGCGIRPEVAARIFDPFFTTKEVGRGTGQGLAITRSIVVERHGGTLTFETDPGHGTTFHVGLPIHAAEAALDDPRVVVGTA